jgi:hypothetical protein
MQRKRARLEGCRVVRTVRESAGLGLCLQSLPQTQSLTFSQRHVHTLVLFLTCNVTYCPLRHSDHAPNIHLLRRPDKKCYNQRRSWRGRITASQ